MNEQKECACEDCKCDSQVESNLKSLLSQYNKELAECEAAMKRTETSLNNLQVQKQQLIGARFAIETVIKSMRDVPTKGESKNG